MTDEKAIKSTVLDYFEGWFDGDAGRMERALHPQLAKRSLGNGTLDEDTAPEMIEATAAGSVVVHSNVYREYLHLGQTDEGWKIVNALWDWA
jgi:hypothetical protein